MSIAALTAATRGGGRAVALRYVGVAAALNLGWEMAQLPLYALWRTESWSGLAFAVVHCTAGDAIILAVTFGIALLASGDARWPKTGYARTAAVATALGIVFTVFSEWLNVEVRRSWAYAPAMPVLPPLGTGLTPLLQWLVIPPVAMVLARCAVPWRSVRRSH